MGDTTKGLYGKFIVRRTDGRDQPGEKHDGCEYFVLDLTHDKHAYLALLAYATSSSEEYPLLAEDLRTKATEMRAVGTFHDTSAAWCGTNLVEACHGAAFAAGWWNDLQTGEDMRGKRNVPELLCLIHSEISEAMEGHRKGLMDDKLPHRSMLEVELADAVIRICDLAGGFGLDLGGAIAEKLAYNAQRADHRPENRLATGGKAY